MPPKNYIFVFVAAFSLFNTTIYAVFDNEDNMKILKNTKNWSTWSNKVSLNVEVNIIPSGYTEKEPYKLTYSFNRNNNMLKWDGNIGTLDKKGEIDPNNNYIIKKIITDQEYWNVTGDKKLSTLNAMVTNDFNEEKENHLDSDEFGGPLFGRIFGNGHKNVIELLEESKNVVLKDDKNEIIGIDCYVVEGSTKHGKVTVWISPTKKYSILKWEIKKSGEDFIDNSPISESGIISWEAVFECIEIQQTGTSFIPKTAKFDFSSRLKDGSTHLRHIVYKINDLQLNPDFESIDIFKIDLPEGTKIFKQKELGIKYIWKNGKIEQDVNESAFDEIDKTIDKFKQKQ